ncbi:MAG TPA: response regulator [Xanthobacteraceae bacterium]|nr:response regulator [Xanthobacteraceae bacterium]
MARIMIAEDEAPIRELLARALVQDGHEVATAANGAAALEKISGDGGFDLLVTDIQMPVMDGIALALAAARDHRDLKVVLMTGYADQRERALGLDSLVREVVQKPFSIAEMREVVKKTLARH